MFTLPMCWPIRSTPRPKHSNWADFRTILGVPLLREGNAIGVFMIARRTPRPFTDKQIELVATFADQAVIAIENVRLFDEVQQRTSDLSEALEQQTATSEVLNVISRSPNQLQPVIDSIVATAADLCQADYAMIHRLEHGRFRTVAANKVEADYVKWLAQNPPPADRGSISGRAVIERATIHVPDVLADPEYTRSESQKRGQHRSLLGVPLMREGVPIGVIALHRTEVRPFTAKQIELVTSFAAQAVIAIENVRLFDEIQDKSRQIELASQHKSQFLANMSHELRTPLNAIIGVTEMLQEDAEALKQDTEPLDRVLGAGRHLLALINDILDLSKIEAGRMELILETFPLAPLIDEVVKTIEPLAAKNGNQVAVHCDSAIGMMHADQMRLRQALLNLMSNANKFTENGTVTIAAHQGHRLGHALSRRYRHWHDAGADGQAVPGVFPGLLDHGEQVRRHGPWPCDQPALLSDDGRRHHGRERTRHGLGVHPAPPERRALEQIAHAF